MPYRTGRSERLTCHVPVRGKYLVNVQQLFNLEVINQFKAFFYSIVALAGLIMLLPARQIGTLNRGGVSTALASHPCHSPGKSDKLWVKNYKKHFY